MTRDAVVPGLVRVVPYLWFALTLAWAILIVATDRPAWEPALWVAATLGPIAALDRTGER